MLAATNLETIKHNEFLVPKETQNDGSIQKINDLIQDEDRRNSKSVVDLYLQLYENDPSLLDKEATKKYNFAPLSTLMADDLKNLSNQHVLNCLKILNTEDI